MAIDISAEFEGAQLGDPRRSRRLVELATRISKAPGASFPQLAATDAELEATYRFFVNPYVEWQSVLAPHAAATVARCKQARTVLVLHDGTQCEFNTDDDAREDLGYLPSGARGFEAHVALAVSDDAEAIPLGLLGLLPIVRSQRRRPGTAYEKHQRPRAEKESERWIKLVKQTTEALGPDVNPIHVMDSAADDYTLWAELQHTGKRFVVRGSYDRYLPDREHRMSDVLGSVEGKLLRSIIISRRKGSKRRYASPRCARRKEREAELYVRAGRIDLPQPKSAESEYANTRLNVVMVYEPNPPAGEPPVEWVLLTSEPICTFDQIAHVVDCYRRRWIIEEFFKALKTGCAYERRQLMSLHALLNALAVLAPIACRLLMLRTMARAAEPVPASDIMSSAEIDLLRRLSKRVKLRSDPNVDDILRAIAGIGGHLKRNGAPGWQTIWKGYRDFAFGMHVEKARKTSDQS